MVDNKLMSFSFGTHLYRKQTLSLSIVEEEPKGNEFEMLSITF